jgi:hypothetical protein
MAPGNYITTVFRRCFTLGVLMSIVAFTIPPGIAQSFFGVPGCDSTPCINPVPCAHCTGSWTDQDGGSWFITSDASGSVTGNLLTTLAGCTTQSYTVTGTIVPVSGNQFVNGAASITLNATDPRPGTGGACSVATYANLTGSIENNGCDLVGPLNASLVTSLNSTTTTFTKPPDIPSGEVTNFQGWSTGIYVTVGQWRQQLQASVGMNGRQVTESSGFGSVTDTCFFTGSSVPVASISGGWWNVGFYSTDNWDDDYVGNTTAGVTYYRQHFRPPCSTTVPQQMNIAVHGMSGDTDAYADNAVGEGIPDYVTVTSTRNGQTQTTTWP